MSAVLELEAVVKSYPAEPPVVALGGVSFSVAAGELVAIVGDWLLPPSPLGVVATEPTDETTPGSSPASKSAMR